MHGIIREIVEGTAPVKRWAVTRGDSIFAVSTSKVLGNKTPPGNTVIPVPDLLSHLSEGELITRCRVSAGRLTCRAQKKPAGQIRLAVVGNWMMRCGIATYSESLWPEVVRHVGDFKLFIERNESPTGPVNMLGDRIIPHDKVTQCWQRGEPLGELERALKDYSPDIVWIQHEFGIWPNAAHWLSFISRISQFCRVVVTMHSVFHHRDKTIVEAVIPEIVVHLPGARDILVNEKGVGGSVTVIPHGCNTIGDRDRLWNYYKSDHTFMQFGFGFRYKGWETSIRTCHELKKRHPDVFFTGLFSESPFNPLGHQVYYDELMQLVAELELRDNVAIIRGYQSDAALDSYLRTNSAVVFPYVSEPGHEVFGVSGAARYAMSKCCPVVTTSANHFADVPTVKADSSLALAEALDRMMSNPLARADQVDRQVEYIRENSWARVALQYVRLFENPPT